MRPIPNSYGGIQIDVLLARLKELYPDYESKSGNSFRKILGVADFWGNGDGSVSEAELDIPHRATLPGGIASGIQNTIRAMNFASAQVLTQELVENIDNPYIVEPKLEELYHLMTGTSDIWGNRGDQLEKMVHSKDRSNLKKLLEAIQHDLGKYTTCSVWADPGNRANWVKPTCRGWKVNDD